jgi:hypothetical protein
MEFLIWLEHSEFSTWMRESDWGHPIVLCFHAVGMALVVGISFMFSARVLGYAKSFPLAAFDQLFGLAWFGFAMNAVSGIVLLMAEPRRMPVTPAFLIKMLLIVFAGFSVWALSRALEGMERAPAGELKVPTGAKVSAIASIVFWCGAIVAGRLIGYTIGPPPPV